MLVAKASAPRPDPLSFSVVSAAGCVTGSVTESPPDATVTVADRTGPVLACAYSTVLCPEAPVGDRIESQDWLDEAVHGSELFVVTVIPMLEMAASAAHDACDKEILGRGGPWRTRIFADAVDDLTVIVPDLNSAVGFAATDAVSV